MGRAGYRAAGPIMSGIFSESNHDTVDQLLLETLPARECTACDRKIARREHRMTLRASWKQSVEVLCIPCWATICQWAARFALEQLELPL